jgi:hypothetical protein
LTAAATATTRLLTVRSSILALIGLYRALAGRRCKNV